MDNKQVIEKQEKKIDYLFALFFYLMLCVDVSGMSAQGTLFRVLCGIAAVCAILKIVSTRWSIGEVIFWTAMVVLGVINYRNSHELYIMLAILSLMACKDVDLQKYWGGGAVLAVVTVLWKSALALLGWIDSPDRYFERLGTWGIKRYALGYLSDNNAHARVLVVIMLVLLAKRSEAELRDYFYLALLNTVAGVYTVSYTGILVGYLLIIMGMCARYGKGWKGVQWGLSVLLLPGILFYTFVIPMLYGNRNPLIEKIETVKGLGTFASRTKQSFEAFSAGFFTWLGRDPQTNDWFFIDNSYAAVWIAGGAVFFTVFFLLQAYTLFRLIRKGNRLEWGLTFGMMVYVMLEYIWTKSFRNITFLFLAESVSLVFSGKKEVAVSGLIKFREERLQVSVEKLSARIQAGIRNAVEAIPVAILVSFGAGMYGYLVKDPEEGLHVITLGQELLKYGAIGFVMVESIIMITGFYRFRE